MPIPLSPSQPSPPTTTTKLPTYSSQKVSAEEDSDASSLGNLSDSTDDSAIQFWHAALDHKPKDPETELSRYRRFLREQSHTSSHHPSTMTKAQVKSKPMHPKTSCLPQREKKQDHTHIVEATRESRDLAGPVEFCFWSMNGQACRCGKC